MEKHDYKRWIFSAVAFFSLIAVWEVVVRYFGLFEFILPPPSDVLAYIWNATIDGTLPGAIWVTIKRLLLGYAIGLCIGIPT